MTKSSNVALNGIKNYEFKNWADTYSCSPALYFEPNTYEEVREILELAKANEKKIRCVGCGHSPSDIACTKDYMVSLFKLNRVLDIDPKKRQIKVEGGTTLDKINKILEENDMAMSVLGSISDQTIAGAISTGNHGTGANFGMLPTYVVEVDLMLANGEIRTYTSQQSDFKGVVLSLGSLGIILAVKLQCEKAFNLEQIEYSAKLEDVLQSLDTYVQSSDHFRMMWFPHTDFVRCYNTSRTDKAKTKRTPNWIRDRFFGYHLLEFLYWIAIYLKFLIPYINMAYYKLFNSTRTVFVDTSYKVFNFDCLMKQYVYEAAIPRKETAYFLIKLKKYLESNLHVKAHNTVEIRFSKSDDIWLSPAYDMDCCYINILMFKPYGQECERSEYWSAFENLLIECKGRPHWAKAHNYKRKDLELLYPKYNEFLKLRESLDPGNLFINDCLNKLFK